MRAPKTIWGNFDNVRFGIIDRASVRVTLTGNWAAVRRAIASGIAGPCAAFAKTNSVSPGKTLASSLGSSDTLTVMGVELLGGAEFSVHADAVEVATDSGTSHCWGCASSASSGVPSLGVS